MSNKLAKYKESVQSVQPIQAQPIQAQQYFATNVPVPRNLEEVEKRCLFEAKKMKARAFYSWTVPSKNGGRGMIEGPSVKLAMMLYRNWTNCCVNLSIVEETDRHFTVRAVFIDLETGTPFPNIYRHRRSSYRKDSARQEDIDLQIAQSKARRNAILLGLPDWLVAECIKAAREADIQQDVSQEDVRKMISAFDRIGVTQEMIETRIGCPIEDISPEYFTELRGVFQAIREGVTSPDDEFTAERRKVAQVYEK